MNPLGGGTWHLTSTYTMEASDGVFRAYLPYFGRAYNAEYGGDGGIEFDGKPEELEIEKEHEKREIIVTFEIGDGNDRYDGILWVGASGYGTLVVNSQNRQSISYYGYIQELQA